MKTFEELIGKVFGRLTVLRINPVVPGVARKAVCICTCGTEKVLAVGNIRNGNSTSCGCLARDVRSRNIRMVTKRLGSEMIGQVFGKVTVVSLEGRTPRGSLLVKYRCECGTEKTGQASWLRSGHVKSCGCVRLEKFLKQITKHGQTAGSGATKEYRAWVQLRSRCRNPNLPNYKHYGGRGITVCERWEIFENFLSDMGYSPAGTSIERIDNSKGYSKENCKWATIQEQAANKRSVHLLEINGISKPVAVWAREHGLHKGTVYNRLAYGWSVERLFEPSCRAQA